MKKNKFTYEILIERRRFLLHRQSTIFNHSVFEICANKKKVDGVSYSSVWDYILVG